jgi:hypothetical protein
VNTIIEPARHVESRWAEGTCLHVSPNLREDVFFLWMCGYLVALIMVRFMRSMLFEISAYDPKNFLVVMGVLSAVVFLACSIPALRATRIDPVVAMRNE